MGAFDHIAETTEALSVGNYWYGGYQHVTDMKDDPAWNFAGIIGDGIGFVQPIAQAAGSRAAATAATVAGAESAAEFVAAASTPIIEAGLWILLGMTTSSGLGTPDRGQDFGNGANAFEQIYDSLDGTGSPPSWNGDGAASYDGENALQRGRAQTMSSTDESIRRVLDAEGADVEDLRGFIDRRATMLTLSIPAAIAAKLIPDVGPAVSAVIELAAVAGTVPTATERFLQMATRTVDNAHRILELAADYDGVGTEPAPTAPTAADAVTVVASDLQRLSTSQEQVATNAVTAGHTTEQTAWNVGFSHGLVCAPNAGAVVTAVGARTAAAGRMQAASAGLAAKLTTAAASYETTDQQQGRILDGEMPPR